MTTTPTHPAPAGTCDPVGTAFPAIGTHIRLLVTDPAALAPATRLTRRYLDDLDRAVSRFRPDSEVSRLARACARTSAVVSASDLFVDHIRAALHAASLSDGLVDPTVGSALTATGYDRDFEALADRTEAWSSYEARVPGWRTIVLDEWGGIVGAGPGTLIDLGSTAKAHAADRVAETIADAALGGVLVNFGGDIATAGPTPAGGWRVDVVGADGSSRQTVALTGQALATSSTQLRTWPTSTGRAHHIIDPRTGTTAKTGWGQVTCVGVTALEANTASTAALVLGEDAPAWLTGHGVAARLEHIDGSVVTTPGWPRTGTAADERSSS